jgi:hypothetical protein
VNSEAASIIAVGILALCLCFGLSKCAKTEVEIEIMKQQLKEAK